MVRLNRTYYSLLNFTRKLFSNRVLRAKFQRITQILRNSPTQSANFAKFALFVNLYIMFQAHAPAENPQEFQRITQIPRNLPTQSANHAKLAPFANIIHYVSDARPVAENSLRFQRIKRNSLNLLTYPANYANSMHFAVN